MSIIDNTVINLLIGFGLNLVFAVIIVRGIYARSDQSKESIFTLLAFNTVVYFVMTFLANTELSVGVGFGLFAIFSLLRYRTTTISTREMTYLFVLIALPVMNSVLMAGNDWVALFAANSIMILVLWVLERGWGFHYEVSQKVRYDRLELLKPGQEAALMADLCERTGLRIQRYELGRFNLVDDTVELTVYFDPKKDVQSSRQTTASSSRSLYGATTRI